ncbi:hypothetical protein MP228_000622 [Amoeboaphelidium protococcarum]|nr:hypothetical protein MP228_000622 [Amoeboaphelidium protococcarum]
MELLAADRSVHLGVLFTYLMQCMSSVNAMSYPLRQAVMGADNANALKPLESGATLKSAPPEFDVALIKRVVLKVVSQKIDHIHSRRDQSYCYRFLGQLYFAGQCRVQSFRHMVAFILYCLRLVPAQMIYSDTSDDTCTTILDCFSSGSGNVNELLTSQKIMVGLESQVQKVASIYLHPTLPDTYIVEGQQFALPKFQGAIQMVLDQCKELSSLLCLPAISIHLLAYDNVQNVESGYGLLPCFMMANKNVVADSLKAFLIKHNILELDRDNICLQYREYSEPLLEQLIWLIHILTGQPPRASEAVELLLENTSSLQRSVMVVMDTLAFLPPYNKTDSITGQHKVIVRFSCQLLDAVLLPYLLVARNIEKMLARDEQLSEILGTYVCAGPTGRWSADQQRTTIKKVFAKSMFGMDMGVKVYRHLSATLVRQSLLDGSGDCNEPPYKENRNTKLLSNIHVQVNTFNKKVVEGVFSLQCMSIRTVFAIISVSSLLSVTPLQVL